MRNSQYFQSKSAVGNRLSDLGAAVPKKFLVGIVLLVALVAFEIFNFDTSQYALRNILGDIEFLGIAWATILALAFCSIDFAGLIRIFTPERGVDEPKEVWYLTGAWLLGATMNAILTWWAVSLALLNHNFGNEVLSREQLLLYVPIFVAVLVWLTRILFIGAFSVAGEHIFDMHSMGNTNNNYARPAQKRPAIQQQPTAVSRPPATPQRSRVNRPAPKPVSAPMPQASFTEELQYEPIMAKPAQPNQPVTPPTPSAPYVSPTSRVRQRPPRPEVARRPPITGVQARPRNRQ
ncbi:MAG TPA: hypothetical protein PLD25_12850 [Chloroflexota bacterium]|nr:hypothetical protein [Chloroflexota bacterium]HUM70406.1 hypothetical protein [Chloroflexota bacterium]